jgi:hypothetical protein
MADQNAVLIKMMNDSLCDVCESLDEVFTATNADAHININMGIIDAVLDHASNVLGVVPAEIRKIKTWEYDRGGDMDASLDDEEEGDLC